MSRAAARKRLSVALTAPLVAVAVAATFPASAYDKDREQQSERREAIRLTFEQQQQAPEPAQRMASTPCIGGMADTYECSNIDLLSFLPLASIGGGNGNDVWGWTDPMTGKEYAIMGRTSGTSFVDVSDPVNPIYLGNLPPHGADSSWRDIKVYSNHAYVVSEAIGHGMQVFDLTQLRTVVAPPVTFAETAHYGEFGSAHNLAINEQTGFGYGVGSATCSEGLHFIDLSTPAAPVFAGCHNETIYTHDAQCVAYLGPDTTHQNREICVNSNETRINIVDVTDKANPLLLSTTTYAGSGYVHQGWMTEDQQYYIQGDELDEQNFGHNTRLRIFDVRDLDLPVLIGTYEATTPAIDHNVYTHDGYVYLASYRAGLRILDPIDIASGTLTEIGFFDIYPGSDSAAFDGAWSVYPYFASGNIIVSGIEQGLFVLRPQFDPDFRLQVAPAKLETCTPGSDPVTIDLIDRNAYVGDVTLGVTGLPVGASSSFTVNPVTVPGTSELTILTAPGAPGSYALSVTSTDGTLNHEETVVLEAADDPPASPSPTAPADAAVDVSRSPTLEWSAVAQAFAYHVEIATDPGFANVVYSTTRSGTMHTVGAGLDPLTTHYWRVRGSNACGAGVESATFSFTTLDIPPILVVDDDDNGPDVFLDFETTLLALGEDFDVWDTGNSDNEPTAEQLEPYEAVIWFTGDEFGGDAGPGASGETALASWLDDSNCLLITSQDYFWDRGLTGFMQSHLGVASATSDVGQTLADGMGAVFAGLGPYTLAFTYSNFTDVILADGTAEAAFAGSQEFIGVDKDSGVFRTSYWGFGLETLPTAADRETVLATFLTWCDALDALDGDNDGASNDVDCAPGDAAVWDAPSPVTGLNLVFGDPDTLGWSAPVAPGGDNLAYDVLRGVDPADFSAASCVESGGVDTAAADSVDPAAGETYYYLIRANNACGSNLGAGTDLAPRTGVSCP